jgi:hypothetical protein
VVQTEHIIDEPAISATSIGSSQHTSIKAGTDINQGPGAHVEFLRRRGLYPRGPESKGFPIQQSDISVEATHNSVDSHDSQKKGGGGGGHGGGAHGGEGRGGGTGVNARPPVHGSGNGAPSMKNGAMSLKTFVLLSCGLLLLLH